MNLVKTISTELNKFGQRVIKFLRYGKSDVRVAYQASPFGLDSNPLKDMTAVFGPTDERGKSVVIGYLNRSMLAQGGEMRLYSLNSSGTLQTYVWLKNNGQLQLGGSAKHFTRFEEMQIAFDQLKTDLNSARAALSLPPSTVSMDAAKTDNVKTA